MDTKEGFNSKKLVANANQENGHEFSEVKISLIGIRRQKSGRYAAVITDRIRHKKVWLGTFDTIEEASQAYLSKKSEFENEKLNHQGSKKGKKIRETTLFVGVHKKKKRGKYNYEITSPISKKRIWLGTFGNVEEASRVDQSKKLEFEVMQQQCSNKHTHSVQDGKSEVDVSVSNVDNGGIDRRIDCHEIGNAEEALRIDKEGSRMFNPGLMANVHGTKSSDECNITTNCDPKDKISLVGTRRQKSGRYSATITDPIKHKKVYLGTFDTIEEASQAYLSKKSEFEKLRQGNKENKPKKNCDQIQQPESSSVVASLDTAASASGRDKRIDSHKTTTHIIGVNKSKTAGRYTSEITNPITKNKIWLGTFDTAEEASRVFNSCLMANVRGTKSSDECNNTTSCNPKDKISLIGIRRQKSGRYSATITDPIKHKKVYLGTFDTTEEASQAYLSKKSEFEKLRQGNKDNKLKNNCDQIQLPESPSVVASLDTAASASGRDKRIDSHKTTTHIIGVSKSKTAGRYTSEITNPITKKKIWLGTFDTAEEASHTYQSKKLEFQNLVKAKQQQCTKKQTHSKQGAGKEKLVNVKQGDENVNCEPFQPESSGGSHEVDFSLSNSSNGGTVQSIDSDKIGAAEEAFHVYQSKKLDSESSKKVELQSNMQTDSCAGEKQGQEDDEDLWMGEWVQLPDDRAVKFSLKLGLPIIDNYGYLLGEFSSLDDLSICVTEDDH